MFHCWIILIQPCVINGLKHSAKRPNHSENVLVSRSRTVTIVSKLKYSTPESVLSIKSCCFNSTKRNCILYILMFTFTHWTNTILEKQTINPNHGVHIGIIKRSYSACITHYQYNHKTRILTIILTYKYVYIIIHWRMTKTTWDLFTVHVSAINNPCLNFIEFISFKIISSNSLILYQHWIGYYQYYNSKNLFENCIC